jgi:tetratricopeptide (TPR) repeat protein
MLFDLRGRGRRRTVQVIYLSLALLMGGGLVLFGIGGDVQGGLFDAFRDDAERTAGTDQIQQEVDRAQQAAQARPRDPAAWAALAQARFQAAGSTGFDENAQRYTAEGREQLRAAAQAWQRHLALDPEQPSADAASAMVTAYSSVGLNQPRDAVRAQEILIEAEEEPDSALFSQLAVLAYQAGQTRKGDLAADRAVELADRGERRQLRQSLEQAKTQVAAGAAGAGAGAGGAAAPSGG